MAMPRGPSFFFCRRRASVALVFSGFAATHFRPAAAAFSGFATLHFRTRSLAFPGFAAAHRRALALTFSGFLAAHRRITSFDFSRFAACHLRRCALRAAFSSSVNSEYFFPIASCSKSCCPELPGDFDFTTGHIAPGHHRVELALLRNRRQCLRFGGLLGLQPCALGGQ